MTAHKMIYDDDGVNGIAEFTYGAGMLVRDRMKGLLKEFLKEYDSVTYCIDEDRGCFSSLYSVKMNGNRDDVYNACKALLAWFRTIG